MTLVALLTLSAAPAVARGGHGRGGHGMHGAGGRSHGNDAYANAASQELDRLMNTRIKSICRGC
jgi:hypothetical protein